MLTEVERSQPDCIPFGFVIAGTLGLPTGVGRVHRLTIFRAPLGTRGPMARKPGHRPPWRPVGRPE